MYSIDLLTAFTNLSNEMGLTAKSMISKLKPSAAYSGKEEMKTNTGGFFIRQLAKL